MPIYPLLLLFMFVTSCNGQDKNRLPKDSVSDSKMNSAWDGQSYRILLAKIFGLKSNPTLQISQYIGRMFQDKTGNLWFGTNGDGVCRYDGKSFLYFTTKEGLSGNAVRGIVQDASGWLGSILQ